MTRPNAAFRATPRLIALLLLSSLAACDKPEDFLPKRPPADPAAVQPTSAALASLQAAMDPCELSMIAAAEPIGQIAAGLPPSPDGRDLIQKAKAACAPASAAVRGLPLWGRLKDPCVEAAYAREQVADGALAILDGDRSALARPALQDKVSDQAAASRRCAGEFDQARRLAAAKPAA